MTLPSRPMQPAFYEALARASESPGYFLRLVRVGHHVTMRQVAAALGVSHVFIGSIERGRARFPEGRIEAFAALFPGLPVGLLAEVVGDGRAVALPVDGRSPTVRRLAATLRARWACLDDEAAERMLTALDDR